MVHSNSGGVVLENPIHALHVESLLDDDILHFGEEQARAELFWKLSSNIKNDSGRMALNRDYYSKRFKVEEENEDEGEAGDSKNAAITKPPTDVVKSSIIIPPTIPSQAAATTTSTTTSNTTTTNTSMKPTLVPSATTSATTLDEKKPTDSQQQLQREQIKMLLPDGRFQQLELAESQVMQQRNSLIIRRLRKSNKKPPSLKRKVQNAIADDDLRREEIQRAHDVVEGWMVQFRSCRNDYWNRIKEKQKAEPLPFGAIPDHDDKLCIPCPNNSIRSISRSARADDTIMKCLDCGFVACAPPSLAPQKGNHDMMLHMLTNSHKLAVTCGKRNSVYCFGCGDVVYHDIFDLERERIDFCHTVPHWSWPEHSLVRSFDPFQFMISPSHASSEKNVIIWRGLIATYPSMVPQQHLVAARMMRQRQQIIPVSDKKEIITCPVGLYNLGNMCFMNGILQCLIHCPPLQQYLLSENPHDFRTCRYFRNNEKYGCLACSMDLLFLEYYGSTIGENVVDQLMRKKKLKIEKGIPLIPSDLLTEAWQHKEMDHLKGYEQRDAHEFLQAFLDIVGKHCQKYQATISKNLLLASDDETSKPALDIVKHLFEGTLRSVSICEDCGCKRSLQEAFLNVSLPLQPDDSSKYNERRKMNIQHCLKQFTAPERLLDKIECPSCKSKTPTKKQQTFSRLPKILCLHLKRFDASKNQKITDFVSFPAKGLDMGSLLPHWCEMLNGEDETTDTCSYPRVLYDLYGTVNHTGTLHQGHYVSHVLVKNQWYYCNDAHVSMSKEEEVLNCEGAYMLFYIRRLN